MKNEPDALPQEVEDAVLEVLAAEGAERTRLLEATCREHPEQAAAIRAWVSRSIEDHLDRIGRFEILGEIGRGGMGVVHRAFDPQLKREIALKVLHGWRSASEELRQRFTREARAIARLDHPGIVKVHEVGLEANAPYFAMEVIAGRDLRSWLASGTNDEPPLFLRGAKEDAGRIHAAAYFVRDVAQALEHAHAQGVQHRDVTPANILVGPGDRPKLLDFGLARLQGEQTLTQTGSLAGTPAYVAPEMLAARRIPIDHRADIYSLGVVLYELLARELPFTGESTERIYKQILMDEPPLLRTRNRGVPADLEAVCAKALEKSPERRYATAGEFVEDLKSWIEGRPTRARPMGGGRRFLRAARRNRAVLASAVGGAALVGLALWFVSGSNEVAPERRAARPKDIVTIANSLLPQRPESAFALAGAAYRQEASALTRSCVLESALSWCANPSNGEYLSSPEPFRFPFARFRPEVVPVASILSDARGDSALVVYENGAVWFVDLRSRKTIQLRTAEFVYDRLRVQFSDSGEIAAVLDDDDLKLHDLPSGVVGWSSGDIQDFALDRRNGSLASLEVIDRSQRRWQLSLRSRDGSVLVATPVLADADSPRLLYSGPEGILLAEGIQLHLRCSLDGSPLDVQSFGSGPWIAEADSVPGRVVVALRDGTILVLEIQDRSLKLLATFPPREGSEHDLDNHSTGLVVRGRLIDLPGYRQVVRSESGLDQDVERSHIPFDPRRHLSAGDLEWSRLWYPLGIADSDLVYLGLVGRPTAIQGAAEKVWSGGLDGEIVAWRRWGLDPLVARATAVERGTGRLAASVEQRILVYDDAELDSPSLVLDRGKQKYPDLLFFLPGGTHLVETLGSRIHVLDMFSRRAVADFDARDQLTIGEEAPEDFEATRLGRVCSARFENGELVLSWSRRGNRDAPPGAETRMDVAALRGAGAEDAPEVRVGRAIPRDSPELQEWWTPRPLHEHTARVRLVLEKHVVRVLTRDSDEEIVHVTLPSPAVAACTSQDGKLLATWTAGEIQIHECATGALRQKLPLGVEYREEEAGSFSSPLDLAISESGHLLATLRGEDEGERLTLHGLPDGKVLWSFRTARIDKAREGYRSSRLRGFVCGDSRLWLRWRAEDLLLPVDVDTWAEQIAFPEVQPPYDQLASEER